MAYEDFKELPRRTASNKILHDKAFNFAKNSKYDGYQRGLGSVIYNFFDKKQILVVLLKGNGMEIQCTSDLTEELHMPTNRKFLKWKVNEFDKMIFWVLI